MVFVLIGTGLGILLLIAMLILHRDVVVLRFFATLNREIGKDIQGIGPMIGLAGRLLEEGRVEGVRRVIDKIKQQQVLIDKAQADLDRLTSSKLMAYCWKSFQRLTAFSPALTFYKIRYEQRRRNERNMERGI